MTTPTIDRERRVQRDAEIQGLVLTRSHCAYELTEETKHGTRFILSSGFKAGGLDSIEEELNKPPQVLPPDYIADDGTAVQTLVFNPALLVVVQTGDAIAVYRSIRLRVDSSLYWPALDLIEGATLVASETYEDDNMFGGSAEHALYQVSA